jgi:hypothetical protein
MVETAAFNAADSERTAAQPLTLCELVAEVSNKVFHFLPLYLL